MNPSWTGILFWGILFCVAAVAELLLGTVGWILPLFQAVFFCYALQCRWTCAAFSAILAGMLLDLEIGRSFPITILALEAMLPALYRMRPAELLDPLDLLGTIAAAAASSEAVYALYAGDLSWFLLLQWGYLSLQCAIITLAVLYLTHFWTENLNLANGFMARSALWKKNRKSMATHHQE